MLDEAVDPLCQDALQVTLPGPSTSVRRHHPRHRRVRAQQRPKLRRRLELRAQHRLKHRQQQMLFPTLVLVAVEREHDRLEEGVNLGEGDEPAEGGDVSGFGLQEEEEVGVLLHLAVVRKVAFGRLYVFQVLLDFMLLGQRVV